MMHRIRKLQAFCVAITWIGLIATWLFQLNPLTAEAGEAPMVRVLLGQQLTAEVKVVSGAYQWIDEGTTLSIAGATANETWRTTVAGLAIKVERNGQALQRTYNGPLLLKETGAGENILEINGKKYRGSLRVYHLRPQGLNNLALLNVIDVESYLAGVVGMEMGYGAPMDALKAQALASRSYALYQRDHRQGIEYYYDLRADQSSQVYRGIDGERPQITKAVNETLGQVVLYDGAIIDAIFHSNAGGQTEDARFVWSTDLPYLRGVATPEDKYAEEWSSSTAVAFRWRKTVSPEVLAERSISIVGRDPGVVTGLRIAETSPSGRVIRLEVIGSKTTISVGKSQVRQFLETPSTKFVIEGDNGISALGEGLSGTTTKRVQATEAYAIGTDSVIRPLQGSGPMYVLGSEGLREVTNSSATSMNSVTVTGYGYGHGVGMSQWGAMGLAQAGKGYRDIIERYYNADRKDGRLSIVENWGR